MLKFKIFLLNSREFLNSPHGNERIYLLNSRIAAQGLKVKNYFKKQMKEEILISMATIQLHLRETCKISLTVKKKKMRALKAVPAKWVSSEKSIIA